MCPDMIRRFGRKEVRELGMTLVINARKKPPSPHLYKALLMAQVKTTNLHIHVRINTCTQKHSHPHTMTSDADRCQIATFLDSQIKELMD